MPGKCRFQDVWLTNESWRLWLREGNDCFTAFCSFCKRKFDVSHSGISAIKSHERGLKHSQIDKNIKLGKQLTLHSFSGKPADTTNISNDNYNNTTARLQTASEPRSSSTSISKISITDSVTKAEILWSAFCVSTHISNRSGGLASDLFSLMFTDSCVAQKMKLHKDKVAYSITYGLGPHFSNLVAESARLSPFFALSIDESLNDVCQKQQMDIMVNYWALDEGRVCTRYLTSAFLETSSALDLLEKITICVAESNLSLENLIQLSTDGPNVNLKLICDLKNHMKNNLNINREILDTGSCSLHVVNGAYKTGHAKVDWKLNQFLRTLYKLFKNYPSRRAVYRQITGSSVFPKKFCSIRWTENCDVIRRCLEMLPNLKTYVKDIKQPPATENFTKLKEMVLGDKTLDAKLHFSAMIAEELEEFLVKFQKNAPLVPFLHQEVYGLMRSLADRFIKKNIMDTVTSSTKLKKIDVSCEANLKTFENIDIGFGARSCFKNVKEIDAHKFKLDCKKFLICVFQKLMEKSPLNKRVILGASCLNPTIMSSETLRISRIKIAIEEFVVHGQLTPAEGDVIMRQYKKFCENSVVQEHIKKFNWKKDKLDALFSKIFHNMKTEDVNPVLVLFVQRILTCFHGNAAVERSFSFNKGFLVENLQEKSLIAQRSVHDHINSLPGEASPIII